MRLCLTEISNLILNTMLAENNIESSKDFRITSPVNQQKASNILELLNRPLSPTKILPSMNAAVRVKENN